MELETGIINPNVLNYADWCLRLHGYLFSARNAGLPITLFVDEDILVEVYGAGDSRTAVASFETAVRSWIVPAGLGHEPFGKIYREAKRWRSRWPTQSASPALPLLAASALAAARMASGEGIAPNNYYVHFFAIADLPNSQKYQNEYGDTIPELWEDLSSWIDESQGGRLGQSTITRDSWFTRIGYALSQSLFRQSDRNRLPTFFRRMGLAPHAAVEAAEILPYFKRWAVNVPLSSGAKRMIAAGSYDGQLGAMLVQAAATWDGAERDEEGRRLGRLALAVQFIGPRGSLVIVGERPPGFPSSAEFTADTGEVWSLRSSGGGWYDESPVALSPTVLREGVVLRAGTQYSLRLPPDPVVPLSQNNDLGRWAATSRLTLGTEHYLLVRDDLLTAVQEAIRSAGGGEAKVASSVANVPAGYTLLRDVMVLRAPSVPLSPELSSLLPVSSDRPVLIGGLPLNVGPATYLRRGEPDVLVPEAASTVASEFLVDETTYTAPPGGGEIALSEMDLGGGHHRFKLGPSALPFFTLETLGRLVPAEAGGIGFRFGRKPGGYWAPRIGAEPLDGGRDLEQVTVCGARVSGAESTIPAGPPAPILVPRGRRRYFVVGRTIGELDELQQPAVPEWLKVIRLYPTGFEYYPIFAVAWLLMEESHFWVARPVQPGAPTEQPLAERAAVHKWCRAVLEGMEARVERDPTAWLEYVLAAEDAAW